MQAFGLLIEAAKTRFKSILADQSTFTLKRIPNKLGRHLYRTHEAIARDLNTSREVISRLLKQLERRGEVTLSRNKISLRPGL